MKNYLQSHDVRMIKVFAFIFLILCMSSGLLLAREVKRQVKSIEEVKVQIPLEGVSVKEAFSKIEEVSEFNFVYLNKEIKNLPELFIAQSNQSIYNLLVKISNQTGLDFKQVNQNIHVQKSKRSSNQQKVVVSNLFIEITGRVTDDQGLPLPGVTIIIEGTSVGTVTDFDGNYTLDAEEGNVLVYSFVGFESQRKTIGNSSVIDVQMIQDASSLEEVVVTAFGIKKEKKSLSYAVQELEGDKLSAVGNTNLVNSIQGKIAGVIVKQSSGAPGSTSKINIRGSRSFVGNNEPLYVVDGMPISSGGRTIDLNPNDIKSMNVLKGPTAAALYGLRASNGVVVIETKKGEGVLGGKPTVTLESNYNFDQLSRVPDIQTTYGQGERGVFLPYSAFSWGPRIDEMGVYTNQLGELEEAAVYDNVGDLFRTGGTSNTNLSISNALDKGNYAINVGMANQDGILKNTGMQRMNIKVAGGYNLTDKLKVNTSINYSNNLIEGTELPWWGTFAIPPSYNLKGKPTHVPGDPFQQINFRGQHDNFYWAMENNYSENRTSRTFGNLSFDYTPFDWLSVNYRIGLDEYTTQNKNVIEKGSGSGRTDPPSGGRISNSMVNQRQINSNLNLNISKSFGSDFNMDFMLGNEVYDIRGNSISSNGSDLVIGGFHHISNTAVQTTNEYLSRSRVVGFYGNLSVSWLNSIFLNATGRNDIVSNMPRGNRSFFYPSIGTGVVFTEFLSLPENILTFGKFRASVAEVGQAGPIFSTSTLFVPGAAVGGFTFPYQGMNAFTLSNALNSSDLKPENTRTFEIGVDLRFFNDRVGLDYTYYDSKSDGQIYRVPIAISTGYTSELRNAGEMSVKGHEIMLNLTPISTQNFSWNLTTNFTTYTNRVVSLAEGIDQLELGGFRVQSVAVEGEEYPSLRGFGYARDPASGEIVVDSRPTLSNGNINTRYGMPLRTTSQVILGSAQPDFDMSFLNSFNFKNFSISAQIDWRKGGKVSSGYNRLGKLYGILSETENREADQIFPGKMGYYDQGNLVVEGDNNITIQKGFDFYRVNDDPISEANVYDATFVRLRELRLDYRFPTGWLQNTFIRKASVFFVGRNLLLSAAMPHFDPEMFNTNEAESYNSYPQTKSFGGGIRVDF
ncbi:SusC/RagA family TonB-linked outer membrane protein [Cyclobacterium marinum]|uniref:SusC/RagA family TonB-linked outer membrane protein n=1 Tax=Cyclobacterium marinum TaxID=104 RepID=UPI0011ED7232|nr:SusC/RagA family TonB-linked outer membrane protein [Cyclobacterium marinum]MBI0397246.1 SusC/RagA family TonB-linked outer membrane protein [Cyclobacterium marinum]